MSLENAPLALEALESKELKVLLTQAFAIGSTVPFFQLVCENIVPLLLSHPSLEACRQEWMTEKEQYQKKFTQYRKQAEGEVKTAFFELKRRCQSIAAHLKLNPLFEKIEEVLAHEKPYFYPSYYVIAYDLFKEVCTVLFAENHTALINDWVKVEWSENLRTYFIKEFLFSPSVAEVIELQEVWNWNRPTPMWVIWEYLYAACWAWRTPAKFFTRKSIDGKSPVQCRHSMELIELHTVWCKMQAIRKGNPEKETLSLFTVTRFSGYLKRVAEQILVLQKGVAIEENVPPYSLELFLERGVLLLSVEWLKGGKPFSYVLKRFYQESESYGFIRDLIEAEPGKRVYVSQGGTQNAAKLTVRAELKGMLGKIFIKDRGKKWCVINCKKAYIMSNLPQAKKLREEILNLPSYEFPI